MQGPIERPSSDAEPLSKPYDLTGFGDIRGPKPIRILKPVADFGLMIAHLARVSVATTVSIIEGHRELQLSLLKLRSVGVWWPRCSKVDLRTGRSVEWPASLRMHAIRLGVLADPPLLRLVGHSARTGS